VTAGGVAEEIRYDTPHNFIGDPVAGFWETSE